MEDITCPSLGYPGFLVFFYRLRPSLQPQRLGWQITEASPFFTPSLSFFFTHITHRTISLFSLYSSYFYSSSLNISSNLTPSFLHIQHQASLKFAVRLVRTDFFKFSVMSTSLHFSKPNVLSQISHLYKHAEFSTRFNAVKHNIVLVITIIVRLLHYESSLMHRNQLFIIILSKLLSRNRKRKSFYQNELSLIQLISS